MNLATPQSPLQARDALCMAPFFACDPKCRSRFKIRIMSPVGGLC